MTATDGRDRGASTGQAPSRGQASPLNPDDVVRTERIQALWSGYGEIERVWWKPAAATDADRSEIVTAIVKRVHPPARRDDDDRYLDFYFRSCVLEFRRAETPARSRPNGANYFRWRAWTTNDSWTAGAEPRFTASES